MSSAPGVSASAAARLGFSFLTLSRGTGAARCEALSGGLWGSTAVLAGGLTAAPHHGERWVEATDPETEQTLTALSERSREVTAAPQPAPVLPAPAACSPPGSDPVPLPCSRVMTYREHTAWVVKAYLQKHPEGHIMSVR